MFASITSASYHSLFPWYLDRIKEEVEGWGERGGERERVRKLRIVEDKTKETRDTG
jgi:hypothetical protein